MMTGSLPQLRMLGPAPARMMVSINSCAFAWFSNARLTALAALAAFKLGSAPRASNSATACCLLPEPIDREHQRRELVAVSCVHLRTGFGSMVRNRCAAAGGQ